MNENMETLEMPVFIDFELFFIGFANKRKHTTFDLREHHFCFNQSLDWHLDIHICKNTAASHDDFFNCHHAPNLDAERFYVPDRKHATAITSHIQYRACQMVLQHCESDHDQRRRVRGGFIHVPWLPEQGTPSMPLEAIVHGLRLAVRVALTTPQDLRIAAGQTH